jgi:hypothetical protein
MAVAIIKRVARFIALYLADKKYPKTSTCDCFKRIYRKLERF